MSTNPSHFKVGNELWRTVKNPGKSMKYTPEELWEKAKEYFQWVEDNPILVDGIYGAKIPTNMDVKRHRPFTIQGFCIFMGMSTANYYTNYKEKSAYESILAIIENIIYNQKFELAAAGVLNPNIIARDLGLVDKRVTENTNKTQVMLYIPDNKRKIQVVAPPKPQSIQIEEKAEDIPWDEIPDVSDL